MMLNGLANMSFMLEATGNVGSQILLRPQTVNDPGTHYEWADTVGDAIAWTADEVAAAANWWRGLAAGREPINRRHVWFGGGVAFGRVSTRADLAVDLIVCSPGAQRPEIDYSRGVEVDYSDPSGTYVTVDTTAEEVARAAEWWTLLERGAISVS